MNARPAKLICGTALQRLLGCYFQFAVQIQPVLIILGISDVLKCGKRVLLDLFSEVLV